MSYEPLKPGQNYANKKWNEIREKYAKQSVDDFFADDYEEKRDMPKEDAPNKFGFSKSGDFNRARLQAAKAELEKPSHSAIIPVKMKSSEEIEKLKQAQEDLRKLTKN